MFRAAVTAALLLAAAPAAAASYIITAFGTLSVAPAANPIGGLPFVTGNSVFASWRVDLGNPGVVNLAPPGSTGTARLYTGTVRNGIVAIGTSSGTVVLSQTVDSLGAILVVDDGSILRPGQPTIRFDQAGITDGLRFAPGPTLGYVAAGLPADVLVRNISFGRSRATINPAVPNLLTSGALPDFGQFIQAQPHFFSFTLVQGNPTSAAAVAALPTSSFNVFNQQVFVAAIPEPATWALLVIGFGGVGATMRRRRPATPEACG